MPISMSITGLKLLLVAGLLAGTAATAAPRSAGLGAGKASMQDMSFTKRSDAVAKCPGGMPLDKPDGSFACSAGSPSSASSSGMAIYEKGHAGTNGTVKTPK